MKRVLVLSLACMLTLGIPAVSVSANSLDDVVSQVETEQTDEILVDDAGSVNSDDAGSVNSEADFTNGSSATSPEYTDQYINNIKEATKLSEPSPGAVKINSGLKKITSFIVQVLSYAITALLVVKVLIDLCYITIPFTRSFLGNGFTGNSSVGTGNPAGGMGGMGGMGMNGMGGGMMGSPMGGMGMGGMRGGYGMRGGMGGMNNGMVPGQAGVTKPKGRIQWVSAAALNAAAIETAADENNEAMSPLKFYAKDMIVVLVLTPILLTLAITGVLTDLGFLIGDIVTNAIASIGTMI